MVTTFLSNQKFQDLVLGPGYVLVELVAHFLNQYFLSCGGVIMIGGAKELSRAVKEEEKRWGSCWWSWNGTTFDVYTFAKIRRPSSMQNRRGKSHGVKRRTRKSLHGSPIQEGNSTQIYVSEWLVCITSMNSPFTRKFSRLREMTTIIFRRSLFSVWWSLKLP